MNESWKSLFPSLQNLTTQPFDRDMIFKKSIVLTLQKKASLISTCSTSLSILGIRNPCVFPWIFFNPERGKWIKSPKGNFPGESCLKGDAIGQTNFSNSPKKGVYIDLSFKKRFV